MNDVSQKKLDKILATRSSPYDFAGANLSGLNLDRANLAGEDFAGTSLEKATLKWVDLNGANLEGANLKETDLHWTNLKGANLRLVNLEGADMFYANLRLASLEGANLKGAYCHGTNFTGANIKGTRFDGANLKGAVGLLSLPMPGMSSRGDMLFAVNHADCVMVQAGFFYGPLKMFEQYAKNHSGVFDAGVIQTLHIWHLSNK